MKSSTTWIGLIAVVLPALALVGQGIVYVVRRIKEGKKASRAWNDVLADGHKPLSGRVWLDGILFGVLLVGPFSALAYLLASA
jgi:hypothetical protein